MIKLEIVMHNQTLGLTVKREIEFDIDACDAYAWDLARVALKGPIGPKSGIILFYDPAQLTSDPALPGGNRDDQE